MAKLTALRGTRDLISPGILRWQEMEETARRVFSAACFSEIRTPVFERTELFERGVGEATDIVSKEMYTFESKSGDRVTLRPENTAGVVRAYVEHGLRGQWPAPVKFFYIGPQFRYERPQKGRQRQFHQLGVEIIDSLDPKSDAEVILVACEFLRSMGLDDLVVDLNSLGDPEDRARHREALVEYLRSVEGQLDPDSVQRIDRNPLRVLDSKVKSTQEALQGAPRIVDFLSDEAAAHFEAVQAQLDACEVKTRLVPTLVRGLDYYSRTTFEIQSEMLGAQSAVCGGGRYDGLVAELGGPAVPAVGFAMGMERLEIILEAMRGEATVVGPDAFLIAMGEEAGKKVLVLARDLRRSGVRCDVSFAKGGFGKQFKAADRRGARFAVVLAEDEMAKGTASVKDLSTGDQTEMAIGDLAAYLRAGRQGSTEAKGES